MAISDVSITSSMRNTLTSLQSTAKMLDRTQNRLATGKKVNSALDNPVSFFAAQNATQRASDLSSRKDGMSEAIQGVLAANTGVTAITSLIESAKGLTQSARSSDRAGRNMLAGQYNTLLDQITQIASDSQYKGKNFLGGDTLQVLFNENGSSFINIAGFNADAANLGLAATTVGTNDITTAGLKGGSGSSVAATVINNATLNSSYASSTVNTGLFFNQIAGAPLLGSDIALGNYTGLNGTSGIQIAVSTNPLYNAAGTTWSGLGMNAGYTGSGYTLETVYANGIILTGGTSYNWSGSTVIGQSGNLSVQIMMALTNVAGLTGQASISITYDLMVNKHDAGTNNASASSVYVYDMSAGDIASGTNVDGLVSGTLGLSGFSGYGGKSVYINSGGTMFLAATGTYNFVDTGAQHLLVFTSASVPTTVTGAISYNYNAGYSSFTGPVVTKGAIFNGISLGATQTLSNVKIDGASANHYSIAGNVITFSGGYEPAAGAAVTYDIITAGSVGTWENDTNISAAIDKLDAALATLRSSSQTLGSTQNILDIRTNFTDTMTATLLKGADNLTLADMNEEGANMLMLQTRQSLGTSTLKMASDSAQSIMRLF